MDRTRVLFGVYQRTYPPKALPIEAFETSRRQKEPMTGGRVRKHNDLSIRIEPKYSKGFHFTMREDQSRTCLEWTKAPLGL